MARPRVHNRSALVQQVCTEIATGVLVRDACEALGFSAGQLRGWVSEDPALAALYARAREEQAHAIAEQAVAIADGADGESELRLTAMVESIASAEDDDKERLLDALAATAVQRDKLRIDTRKWLASKIAPRNYGERLELAGDKGAPLNVKVTFSRE